MTNPTLLLHPAPRFLTPPRPLCEIYVYFFSGGLGLTLRAALKDTPE